MQLLSVSEQEGWQNRAVCYRALGETPRGMWAVARLYHLGPFRVEESSSEILDPGGEQMCPKHPW